MANLKNKLEFHLIISISIFFLSSQAQAWDENKMNDELKLLKKEAFLPEPPNKALSKTDIRKRQRQSKVSRQVVDLEARYFENKNDSMDSGVDTIRTRAAAPLKSVQSKDVQTNKKRQRNNSSKPENTDLNLKKLNLETFEVK